MTDPDKIAEAAAKMRRPELHLHPEDVGRLANMLAPTSLETERDRILASLAAHAPLASIAVVSDRGVEPGHMWLVDADPEPVEFVAPPPLKPETLEWHDHLRNRWTTIGMDLGYGPGSAVVGTFEGDRLVDMRAGAALPTPARRPWRLVGRAATRARWRRQGRR